MILFVLKIIVRSVYFVVFFSLNDCSIQLLVLVQTSDGTKVGLNKGRTVQMPDLQMSDWYKPRKGTNIGLEFKRRTSINIGRVHFKEKRRTWLSFEKILHCSKK